MTPRPGEARAPGGSHHEDPSALRQCVLAVAVLHGVDLVPAADGVALTADPTRGAEPPVVSWAEVADAVGLAEPGSPAARARVARWLRLRRALADLPPERLVTAVRALGLPRGHVLHPGPPWVAETVRGGVLDLGLGLVCAGGDEGTVLPVPPGLLRHAGVDPAGWWSPARAHLEETGARAAERPLDETPVLGPLGPTDVVTLLAAATYRAGLVDGHGGVRTVSVPLRRRGWLDVRRVDPAFVLAAAAAVDPEEAGFFRPLLVTRDEVGSVAEDGDPVRPIPGD